VQKPRTMEGNVDTDTRIDEERYRNLYEQAKRNEDLYLSLLNSSADGVAIYDMEGRARFVNPSFTAIFGWTREDVLGKGIPFVPDSERRVSRERIEALILTGKSSAGFETKRYTKDGRILDVSLSASRYHDHEGRPSGILVILRDITASKKVEQELHKSKETVEVLLNATSDSVFLLDADGRFLAANNQTALGLGRTVEELIGQPASDFLPPSAADKEKTVLRQVLAEGKGARYEEHRGGYVFFKTYYPVFDKQGKIDGAAVFVRDITERKRAESEREKLISELVAAQEALHFQATHDYLSGLLNRSAVIERLQIELARSQREGTPLGVIMADIDHFKQVNDLRGHAAGDAVLCEVAHRMTKAVRPYDSVGRYGGEEFVLVLPGCDVDLTVKLAERLRSDFSSRPIAIREGTFIITVSFGVTGAHTKHNGDVDSIIRSADMALYRAKNRGRNRVEA
jgi:diguanylate cyclase (GGDEF)-like protein/PAS domain S-box-containing protein